MLNNKKQKNTMWFAPIIVVIFVIALIGFGFFLSRSPKMVFNTAINKMSQSLIGAALESMDNREGSISLETKFSSDDKDMNDALKIMNNMYFGIDYKLDQKNKKYLMKINTKYDGEELLNADVYLEDTNVYILLVDLYNQYLSTELQDVEVLWETNKSIKDYKAIVKGISKAITTSLKSEYFTKETVELTIDDNIEKATKNTLLINNNNIIQIEVDVLTSLKNNNSFINSLSNITEIDKEDILANIDELINSLSGEEFTYDEEITISIYTKGLINEFVRMDLKTSADEEKTTIELIKENNEVYNINLISQDFNANFTVKMFEDSDGKQNIEFSMNEPTTNSTLTYIIKYATNNNIKFDNIDVSNNVALEELTEQALTEIGNKLMESKGIQKLVEDVQNHPIFSIITSAQNSAEKRTIENYGLQIQSAYYMYMFENSTSNLDQVRKDPLGNLSEYLDDTYNDVVCEKVQIIEDDIILTGCTVDGGSNKYNYSTANNDGAVLQ